MGFCPICGKSTTKKFCEEHTVSEITYRDIVVRVCACGKYFYRNQWLPFKSLKKVVEKIVKESIKEKVKVNADVEEIVGKKKFEAEVLKGAKKFLVEGKTQLERCPDCSRMTSGYFEAIIQLRPLDQEILDFVRKQAEKEAHAFISKEVVLKEGFDLYVSSNKFALKVGKKLSQSFKGELKTTRTLHTRDKQRSKDLYRATVCFRKE